MQIQRTDDMKDKKMDSFIGITILFNKSPTDNDFNFCFLFFKIGLYPPIIFRIVFLPKTTRF